MTNFHIYSSEAQEEEVFNDTRRNGELNDNNSY